MYTSCYSTFDLIILYTLFAHTGSTDFFTYRQLTGSCWGWLGRKVRSFAKLCSCGNKKMFPSEQYPGFK